MNETFIYLGGMRFLFFRFIVTFEIFLKMLNATIFGHFHRVIGDFSAAKNGINLII